MLCGCVGHAAWGIHQCRVLHPLTEVTLFIVTMLQYPFNIGKHHVLCEHHQKILWKSILKHKLDTSKNLGNKNQHLEMANLAHMTIDFHKHLQYGFLNIFQFHNWYLNPLLVYKLDILNEYPIPCYSLQLYLQK